MKEVIEFYNKYDEDNRLKSKTHFTGISNNYEIHKKVPDT